MDKCLYIELKVTITPQIMDEIEQILIRKIVGPSKFYYIPKKIILEVENRSLKFWYETALIKYRRENI